MKNILQFSVFALLLAASSNLLAQADLRVTFSLDNASSNSRTNALPVNSHSVSASVSNIGDQASLPVSIRLWVSVNASFSDANPATSNVVSIAACPNPTDIRACFREFASRRFSLSLPGEIIPPGEELTGDTRTTSQWMGEKIYVRACLSINGGPFTQNCQNDEVYVGPQDYSSELVSDGTDKLGVFVEWRFAEHEDGTSLADSFIVSKVRLDSTGGFESLELDLASDVEEINDAGLRKYRYFDSNVEPGVAYRYLVRPCVTLMGLQTCSRVGSYPTVGAVGNRFATFEASTGTRTDGIEVQWAEYSTSTLGYALRRCDASNRSDCEQLVTALTGLSFLDTNVGLGETYVYEISACTRYEPTDPTTCDDGWSAPTGETNIAFVGVTPDQFENDNDSGSAIPITANAPAPMSRNFDQLGDVDWLRFTLTQASDISIVASNALGSSIGIALFDSNLVPIGTRFPLELEAVALAPGEYFIRLTDLKPNSGTYVPIPYNVELSTTVNVPNVVPDQFEDDNTAALAKPIAGNASAQEHTFHVDGDIDWLRFSLSETSGISVDTVNNDNANIRIELYNSSLGLIGNPSNSRLQELALDAGDYFIRVVDGRNGAFLALEYSIALSASPVVTVGIQPDKFENDDIPRRAQIINRATSQIRSFHTADNNDWIRIVLDKQQSITLATRGSNLADTQVFLFNSELRRLDYSANTPGVATSHARLVTDTLAAGEYYALINQIDGRPDGFAFQAIEQYELIVVMEESDKKVDLTPILNLLLDE